MAMLSALAMLSLAAVDKAMENSPGHPVLEIIAVCSASLTCVLSVNDDSSFSDICWEISLSFALSCGLACRSAEVYTL